MNQLTKFLVDSILNEDEKQVVALFGGGFKPPTKGHLDVVINGLRQAPEANKLKIIVGGGEREGFTQDQSYKIWQVYKGANLIPTDVEIIKASPFKYYKDYLTQNPNDKVYVFVGSRPDDEKDQFDVKQRSEYVKKYSDNVIPIEVSTTGGVSGTMARDLFKNNIKSFRNMFPDNLSDDEYNQILAILGKKDIEEGRKKKKDPKKGTGKKPKGSGRRLYTDEDPKDTVGIKFSTRQDIVDTLNKKSFKSKSHARQSQIINLIHQRVRAAYGRAKDPAVKKRLKTGLDYITNKKEASKAKTQRLKKQKSKNENINEIGDAGIKIRPWRFDGAKSDYRSAEEFKDFIARYPDDDLYNPDFDGESWYKFTTEQGTDYEVQIDYVWVDDPNYNTGFIEAAGVDFYAGDAYDGRMDKSMSMTNKGEVFEVMATVTDIVISWLNEWGKVFYIDSFIIEPKVEESEKDMMYSPDFKAAMTKRGRLYKAYIEKQISKLDTKYTVNDRSGRFEITPIGEKNQKENIDPKAQAKHKGKAAPYGSGYDEVKEGDTYEKMAAKGKKAGNLKQGTVRKRLGIPKDKKIPLSKINKEISRLKKMDKDKDKKGVQLGDKNQKYYKALQLSKTLKTTTNVNESEDKKYYNFQIRIKNDSYDGLGTTFSNIGGRIQKSSTSVDGNPLIFNYRNVPSLVKAAFKAKNDNSEILIYNDEGKGKVYPLTTQNVKLIKRTTPLNENATYSSKIDYKQQIKDLTKHMLDKGMNIKPLPKVIFKHGDQENASQFLGKTAYYSPDTQEIVLYTEGRHPKDIARSFAHEMIHHIQNLENRLEDINTTNTNDDDHLNDIEREAYTRGNMVFRNWTDNMDGTEVSSLNEKKKPYKHKHGFDDKLGKDPFGLNQYARELVSEVFDDEPFTVYCDMDGVLCDFDLQFKELTNGISPKDYKAEHGVDGFWKIITEQGEKFWSEMPWTPEGKKLWSYIKKYNPILLSAPSNDNSSRIGKRQWVDKNLPGVTLKLASKANKPDYATNDKDVLIDDWYGTIVDWKNKGSIGIWYNNYSSAIKQLQKAGL